MTATLLALLVLVTLTAAAVQAKNFESSFHAGRGGSISPTVRDNRIGLRVERSLTNRALERRCREGRYWPAVRSVWAIPRRHVGAVLQRELRRQRYARTLSSRCLASPAAVIRHVFPDATEDGAVRVAACESTGDTTPPYSLYPRAVGDAGERGLFQIHPQHRDWIGEKRWRQMFDPLVNARVAYGMSNGGRNWSAWTCGWAA